MLTAGSGEAGIAQYRKHRDEVVAVVLDMSMPGMNGRETYLGLRAIDPEVAVLLITGFALNHEAQQILDLGVRGFLAKPFDRIALSEGVARVIRR